MRMIALASTLALSTIALPAFAGERTAFSSVPVLPAVKEATVPPAVTGVPGVTVATKETKFSRYVEVTSQAANGYCLVSREDRLALSDSSSGTVEEVWRLTEKDGAATLERTKFESTADDAWVRSRTSVQLRALAHEHGLTVWGMREPDGTLVILAKGATSGIESMKETRKKDEELPFFSFASSSCGFGATRVTPLAFAKGAVAQISGELPGEGEGKAKIIPRFTVDVSVSKLSRDPEAMLSVRVRRIDPSS